ncbi:hypothetical protein [Xenophilus sp. Marseille-Q4582]|uniref:hypothetical protein n=1 Tax=Xenophilus sp. Marseille-Q4582 TaxID=2866600 RepID=UPI001CE3C90A|nr:hypothetical protein [Xenophilus sp. Marseille-Q4582]
MPTTASPRAQETRQDRPERRGGATQLTPEPGTNGRMNERDNRRILRIAVVLVIALLAGVLAFNAFYLPRGGSTTDAPVQTSPLQNAPSPAGTPNTAPGTEPGTAPAPR